MTALRQGFLWAALASLAFGITTPLIALFGTTAGPWATAGWLYLGGALFSIAVQREPAQLASGFLAHGGKLATIALVGGMLAPAAYVFGLRATGPLAASLALNMEAPLSALLAVGILREHVGRRAALAMSAIVIGASVIALPVPGGRFAQDGGLGVMLVILATALWAIDNALCAQLPEVDPRVTVFWKSALGGGLSLAVASLVHERCGSPGGVAVLLLIGGLGYGASLYWYLIAQRRFGITRTASIFAVTPFIGAIGAVILGTHAPSGSDAVAAAFMLAGVWLHISERHAHEHRHPAEKHAHPHRHDDRHHDHRHDHPVAGEHTHPHVHAPLVHAHEHAPDPAHAHEHD